MDAEQCSILVQKFVSGLPKPIAKQLEDVELLVCPDTATATAELREQMEGEDGKELEALPDDTKGVFIGEPMESEEDADGDGDMETVTLPSGIIVIVASNVKDADEVVLVVLHEIGHALGMDEEEVKALGLGVSPSTTGASDDGSTPGASSPPV